MRRIGVDVGGTNTDAALLDGADVVATAKASTTQDTITGIVHSLQLLRQKVTNGKSKVLFWLTEPANDVPTCSALGGSCTCLHGSCYLIVVAQA